MHTSRTTRLLSRNFTQVQINNHLSSLCSLQRYQNAFSFLFALALRDGLTIDSPLDALVGLLIQLHADLHSRACNAYSAPLLVPGFYDLNFHPLLRQVKKEGFKHTPRYAVFLDCIPIFVSFLNTLYDIKIIAHAHIRLILLWGFLGFFRSIDLHRTKRLSCLGERRFVCV